MKSKVLIAIGVVSFSLIFSSCKKKKEGEEETADNFNKTELLTNISDNVIIPAYTSYKSGVDSLELASNTFVSNKNTTNLLALRVKFVNAYLLFQNVSTFEFGPAENEIFRSGANTFPCDTPQIKSNVNTGIFDLNMASNFDAKGYPALDYMLYGKGKTDQDILNLFASDSDAVNRCNYFSALVTELRTKATSVLNSWTGSYRSTFVSSNSSDVGSSVGLLVNQLSQDLEITKNYRVGIPAGKKTMGALLPEKCEAYYSKASLALAKKHVESLERIYLGNSGKGFDDYLDFLNAKYNGGSLNATITNQFSVVKTKLNAVPETLDNSIVNNFAPVDAAYTELQRLVVLIKADMPSALGIVITYQDTDGD